MAHLPFDDSDNQDPPMARPDGTLTPAQHEILKVIWAQESGGATVAEVWQQISQQRDIARTTILNQIDRLEKRGWLRRVKIASVYRYHATVSQEEASQSLAQEFVDDFFGGSASKLVMNLLGAKRLQPDDVERLRRILDSQPSSREEGR